MPTWQQIIPGRQTSPFAPRADAASLTTPAPSLLDGWTAAAAAPQAASFAATDPATGYGFDAMTSASMTDLGAPNDGMTSWGGRFGDVGGQDPFTSWANVKATAYDDYGFGGQQDAYNQQVGGQAGIAGGNWAALDAHNAEINAAAARYGVPANLIKSMINRESSGNWDANNYVYGGLRGQRMLPFVGIFESTASSWGLDFDAMVGNKQAQIDGMARIIKGLSDQYGGFENAAYVYFGGEDALPGRGGFVDEYGMDSNTYGQKAIDGWRQLDQLSGYAGAYTGGGSFDVSGLFSGGQVHDWGEFGADSDNGFYGYGTQYGLNGRQHTGVDVAMPVGSAYRAPMGGTVMCAGTGQGTGADGSSCAAFGDYFGNGAGRVEVLLDNGAVLIYGHSSTAALRPGQRFNAGDVLGTSGGMVSPHIHLEARVRDPSTPSGWRIVDPRTVLGGGGIGGGGVAPQTQQRQSFSDLIRSYLFR